MKPVFRKTIPGAEFLVLCALAAFVVITGGCMKTVDYATPTENKSSREDLDWPGCYAGVLPGDGGLSVEVELSTAAVYQMSLRPLSGPGEMREESGRFEWDDSGNIIIFGREDSEARPFCFLVGDEVLVQLDADGLRITGEDAGRYILKKQTPLPK